MRPFKLLITHRKSNIISIRVSVFVCIGALILSGRPPDHLTNYVVDMIKTYDLPALRVNMDTANIVDRVQKFVSKLNLDDRPRVTRAVSHYEKYIDFDTLLG